MAQTKGTPQFGDTLLVPEALTQADARWTDISQATLDWGPALASADTRAQASGSACIVVPPGVFNVASNETIVSNVLFQPGAQLSINSGKTVTFSGIVWAPQTQIFAGSGTATLNGTDQTVFGTWTGSTGVKLASGLTLAGILAPNAMYVSSPIVSATATTVYSFGFVVPNDGPTWKVAAISYRYHVAGPAALTFVVTADPSATAVGAGTAQNTAADLNAVVADTAANAVGIVGTTLAAGATLGLKISSATQTGLANLQVTCALQRVS